MRTCVTCKVHKPETAYKFRSGYYKHTCKSCLNKDQKIFNKAWKQSNRSKCNSLQANRHATKLQRTVPWADKAAIAVIYRQAQQSNQTVDHVIPLQGTKVSGLHCEDNLRVLPHSDNFGKCNKFDESLLVPLYTNYWKNS
jgi:hypothetical protein